MTEYRTPRTSFPALVEKEELPRFTARKNNLNYSSMKLMKTGTVLIKKTLLDAQMIAEQDITKGGIYFRKILESVKRNGIRKGYNPDHFFVESLIIGRAYRGRKIEYKAKGRNGIIRMPKSSITVTCVERPMKEYTRDALIGKFPISHGIILRKQLFQE